MSIGPNAPTDSVERLVATIDDLRRRVSDLERVRPAVVPWISPTLTNGWVNVGGAEQTAGYRKIGDVVYLRGLIKDGTLAASAFTLPVGYRPPAALQFAIATNITFGLVYVNTSGAVQFFGSSNAYASLNFSFSTTA